MAGECSMRKCHRPALKRGMCNRCYLRWWKQTPKESRPEITTVERFMEKVDKDGPVPAHASHLGSCWLWTSAVRPSGHGEFSVSQARGNVSAHSYALELATGSACPDGQEACHRCDNPPCVRPSHIYFGTRQQNTDDAWHRERHPVGSERPAARLTEVQVEEIRVRYAGGESGSWLAKEFGMRPCSIYQITSGVKWPNAAGPITRKKAS